MRTNAEFGYHFTTHGRVGFDSGWQHLSEADIHETEQRLESIFGLAGPAPIWAQDLLRVARAVYVVDKRSPRDRAEDGWTRVLNLSVQVAEPERWTDQARHCLNELLRVLTADEWQVTVHGGAEPHDATLFTHHAEETALFSGGIDSTAYAAGRARAKNDELVLVAYSGPLKNRQRELISAIRKTAERVVQLRQLSQTALGHGRELDQTSRSRGLLFIATGVCVAAAHCSECLAVPENGQLAVNPPLTASRIAACSTRSVHPWTLDLINRVIRFIGGDVWVDNPFLGYTKGEVCTRAIDAGLQAGVLVRTVSCGHPRTPRRHGPHYNCGYCYPCLVRRSGLYAATGDYRTGYWKDLSELDGHKAQDLDALRRWLAADVTIGDLIADMPLPVSIAPSSLLPVLIRGREELTAMLQASLPT